MEEGADVLRTWWKSVRDLYAKLICKTSCKAAANLTDRKLFIQRNCAFLHKDVKPRKGQPLRNIHLTQETLANQPPEAQHSASTSISHQPSHDVEEQEEDEGSLSLIETQAALTRSQGTPPPLALSFTTTKPRRAATRAEPKDAPAMLEIIDSMKATNALLERLVQAQEISHARQPFITYTSQSLQQLPDVPVPAHRRENDGHPPRDAATHPPPTPSSSTTSSIRTFTHTHLLPAVAALLPAPDSALRHPAAASA
ncbi:hypothetical protein DPMN_184036 [Dreissena polymorpha]|uniref:Uncharacterized protein n=1 Tax=Dreissena polymorpha TaxID=45954 RepID=A0A9D4DIH5_DREPO|nr:hypothetical protein DPMN_184036 [Dreissena polymorpha]